MKILRLLVVMALTAGLASFAYAEDAKRTANISEVNGEVSVRQGGEGWVPAQVKMVLSEGAIIKTKPGSEAVLNVDGAGETATITVRENSQLMFTELRKNDQTGARSTFLELGLGKILIKAQKLHSEKERFEVQTPTTIVGVRGTEFEVEVGMEEED